MAQPPMLTHYQLLHSDVRPALLRMFPQFQGRTPECMLLTIAGQETNLAYVYQMDSQGKPIQTLARGLWQFELVGVEGCLNHPANGWLAPFLEQNGFAGLTPEMIHWALPASTSLATWLARANLWWYAEDLIEPIADYDHAEAAWQQYLDIWRPGKPHRETWDAHWLAAVEAVNISVDMV